MSFYLEVNDGVVPAHFFHTGKEFVRVHPTRICNRQIAPAICDQSFKFALMLRGLPRPPEFWLESSAQCGEFRTHPFLPSVLYVLRSSRVK